MQTPGLKAGCVVAAMNDFLNQLVGLCAGRGALLRLERRQLSEQFKSLSEDDEHKDACLSDCQICMDLVSTSTDAGKDPEPRGFPRPWEQPNHGTAVRQTSQTHRPAESVDLFDPYVLLRIQPIPILMRTQQAQQLQKFTIPPTWSGKHKTSFPSIARHAPSVLPRSDPCKIGRNKQSSAKRVPDANSGEAVESPQRGNRLPRAVTDSHRFHAQATSGHTETVVSLRRRNSTSVCLDKSEANMKSLTIKLIRERRVRREIVLGGPENRYRIRVEVDAANTSPEELEQARQSTTFRADCRLQYQFPDAGRVDVYKTVHALKSRRWYRGWVGR